jgi:hypothetical protein
MEVTRGRALRHSTVLESFLKALGYKIEFAMDPDAIG